MLRMKNTRIPSPINGTHIIYIVEHDEIKRYSIDHTWCFTALKFKRYER